MTPQSDPGATELIICTTCRPADNPREQRAAGDILLEAVQAAQAFGNRPEWAAIHVRGEACTAGCSRACTVAFQAPGKHSFQFGDLAPSEDAARQLLDCAVMHSRAPDGKLPREGRPVLLRSGILCRLPPTRSPLNANMTQAAEDLAVPKEAADTDRTRATEQAFSPAQREAVYRAIFERRDMRHFSGGAVAPDVMRRLLTAAHNAPSVGFMQPWRFLRVASRELRAKLQVLVEQERQQTATALGERMDAFLRLKVEGLMDAAEVWVVAMPDGRERHVFGRRTLPHMDLASTACAIQNLWLATRAEGLGMGWVSMFDPAAVASLLGMPEGAEPVALLCIGPVRHFYEDPMLQQQRWAQRMALDDVLYEDAWGQPLGPHGTFNSAGRNRSGSLSESASQDEGADR